jgi:hypothetical protein
MQDNDTFWFSSENPGPKSTLCGFAVDVEVVPLEAQAAVVSRGIAATNHLRHGESYDTCLLIKVKKEL